MRRAFTLLELLVAISIIAVLIGLLIPAIQAAREIAHRAQCQSHMRQWALAMHGYESACGHFPAAVETGPLNPNRHQSDVSRTLPTWATVYPLRTWAVELWPFVEQVALRGRWNDAVDFWAPPNCIAGTLDGPAGARPAIYYCPSDRPGAAHTTEWDWRWRAAGNYGVNWGQFPDPWPWYWTGQHPAAVPPFGFLDREPRISAPRMLPRRARLASFTDGTSSTLLLSETLIPLEDADDDVRGEMLNTDFGATNINTFSTPNSLDPDLLPDPWCVNRPEANLPCNLTPLGWPTWKAARSRHRGGVNAAYADGSVHFVRDNIAPATWAAMGTMNGGEAIQYE